MKMERNKLSALCGWQGRYQTFAEGKLKALSAAKNAAVRVTLPVKMRLVLYLDPTPGCC